MAAVIAQMVLAGIFVVPAFGQSGAILTTLQTGINFANAPLVQGSDGSFYGTAGAPPYGNVFKVGADGTLSNLHDFSGADGSNAKGLVQGSDGYLYGVTAHGGTNGGNGTVFKISTNGAFASLYSFGGADGAIPETPLVQGSDGYFYGTTDTGGASTNSAGTVFKISADGSLTSLYSFTDGSDGSGPAGLVQGSHGYFYGTTYSSAASSGYGTVFKISATGTPTTLYTFTGGSDGGNPGTGLAQGVDGNFYGTTMFGGAANRGTVFKISSSGSLTTLYSFGGGDQGSPMSAMMQGADGYLYGITSSRVFRVSAAGAVSTLYSVTSGQLNGLVQGSDGYLYGTTFFDTVNNGRFFRLTVLPVFQPVARTNDTLTLTWSTEPGWKYQLMYSSDLSSGTWTGMGDVLTASGPTLRATDWVTNAPQRWYRVALVP